MRSGLTARGRGRGIRCSQGCRVTGGEPLWLRIRCSESWLRL